MTPHSPSCIGAELQTNVLYDNLLTCYPCLPGKEFPEGIGTNKGRWTSLDEGFFNFLPETRNRKYAVADWLRPHFMTTKKDFAAGNCPVVQLPIGSRLESGVKKCSKGMSISPNIKCIPMRNPSKTNEECAHRTVSQLEWRLMGTGNRKLSNRLAC